MSNVQVTSHPLRCFCSRTPLLATYGVNEDGKPYIHIKVYKQRRIYGNIRVTGGTTEIQCRECLRWYRVIIIANKASLSELADISVDADAISALDGGGPPPVSAGKVTNRDD